MDSLKNKIEKIMSKNKGEIFSINDFYDIASKNTVKSILYRLSEENKIVRLIDGLYTMPMYSKILKEYSYPDAEDVAEKIASKFSWTIAPTSEVVLNYVGISTQISNEYIYISDGEYREYTYRDKKIVFKHTANRNILNYSKELLILIQSIKTLGKENINDENIKKLALFAKNIGENLNTETLKLPFWIKEILNRIMIMNRE